MQNCAQACRRCAESCRQMAANKSGPSSRSETSMKTVVGLFDSFGEAQSATRDLITAGYSRDDIGLFLLGQ
jgi:hypothetical protein